MDSNRQVCTRFAPSPTGYMHIGNLRTALYAYLLARSSGGKFIVRIEDTDRERLVEGAVDVILNTLRVTGLDYDEGPEIGGPNGPYVQSERKPIYREYAEKLVEKGAAYYCFCTEERLASLHEQDENAGYDRRCRNLTQDEIQAHLKAGDPYVIRQKIPLEGTTSYTDEVFGEISMENKDMQDQILLKADGYPTYNFAHVVDDYLMGVTHVVRGSEYLTSTPKYVLLYDAFGWERPHYVHLPLLMGKETDEEGNVKISKLSKRHGAVSFQDLVSSGYLPEAVVNYISLLGWCPKNTNEEIFSLDQLKELFSIDGINKSPAVFDYEKLRWFNSEYIKAMPDGEFAEKAMPYIDSVCPENVNREVLCGLLHGRTAVFSDIPEAVRFTAERLPADVSLYINKKNKTTPESCRDILKGVLPELENASSWTNDDLFSLLKSYSEEKGIKAGAVMWAVRVAVARQAVTPGGATEIMTVLGRDESLGRIGQALEELA